MTGLYGIPSTRLIAICRQSRVWGLARILSPPLHLVSLPRARSPRRWTSSSSLRTRETSTSLTGWLLRVTPSMEARCLLKSTPSSMSSTRTGHNVSLSKPPLPIKNLSKSILRRKIMPRKSRPSKNHKRTYLQEKKNTRINMKKSGRMRYLTGTSKARTATDSQPRWPSLDKKVQSSSLRAKSLAPSVILIAHKTLHPI